MKVSTHNIPPHQNALELKHQVCALASAEHGYTLAQAHELIKRGVIDYEIDYSEDTLTLNVISTVG